MNIYAGRGHKVMVTEETAKYGYNYHKEMVKENLEIGKEYTVSYIEVSDSSTRVYLKEAPDHAFNSVNFVDVPGKEVCAKVAVYVNGYTIHLDGEYAKKVIDILEY